MTFPKDSSDSSDSNDPSDANEAQMHCDFHCHSLHSDGVLQPEELANAMKANGVETFALTDHDTIAGVAASQAAAQNLGITCLAGIELTIRWNEGTFHLLGLGMNKLSALQEKLDALAQRRQERNEQILDKLRKLGIAIEMQDLLSHSAKKPGETLNRTHIASYLADFGHCQNYYAAFEQYLAHGAAAYVSIEGPSPEEGFQWIRAAGGWSFIAHPHLLNLNWQKFEKNVYAWQRSGLNGLEISHPRTKHKNRKLLSGLCRDLEMLYCGGSDYHRGPTEAVLGRGTDGKPIKIPKSFAYLQIEAKE